MELELPGGEKARNRLPLYLGLGALVVGLMVFRRPQQSGGGGALTIDPGVVEFRRIAAAAEGDMRQLTAMNDLKRYELDLAARNTPAGLRECYTGEQWRMLPDDAKRTIKHQAKRGGSAITGGPNGGVCVVPTDRGIAGDLQTVQRAKSGLFSSSSRGVGAAAPPVPRSVFGDVYSSYADMVSNAFAAYSTGGR